MATTKEEVQEEVKEVKGTKSPRVRRVSSEVTLPKEGSTVGNIILNVAGYPEPLTFDVDFANMQTEFVQAAALAGMSSRLGIAYGGLTDPSKIVGAINKEFDNFIQGKYISRSSSVKKVNAPDVVLAWMAVMGVDSTDQDELTKYVSSWNNRNDENKEKISKNKKVIIEFERIQTEKRLAKKQKDALKDDSALEL